MGNSVGFIIQLGNSSLGDCLGQGGNSIRGEFIGEVVEEIEGPLWFDDRYLSQFDDFG